MARDPAFSQPSSARTPGAAEFILRSGLRGRAALFDLNGTLTDDEGLIFEIFRALLESVGISLQREPYFRDLVGLDDMTIIRRSLDSAGLPRDEQLERRLLRGRIDQYRERFEQTLPIQQGAVELLSSLASRVPTGLVSAAYQEDIDVALDAAGLRDFLQAVVRLEDVARPKPDPECYRVGLNRLRRSSGIADLKAEHVVVFEDSAAGVQAAKGAGMTCVAVLGTKTAAELAEADLIVEELSADLLEG
jgi:beta-phosphoglucomutase